MSPGHSYIATISNRHGSLAQVRYRVESQLQAYYIFTQAAEAILPCSSQLAADINAILLKAHLLTASTDDGSGYLSSKVQQLTWPGACTSVDETSIMDGISLDL